MELGITGISVAAPGDNFLRLPSGCPRRDTGWPPHAILAMAAVLGAARLQSIASLALLGASAFLVTRFLEQQGELFVSLGIGWVDALSGL